MFYIYYIKYHVSNKCSSFSRYQGTEIFIGCTMSHFLLEVSCFDKELEQLRCGKSGVQILQVGPRFAMQISNAH